MNITSIGDQIHPGNYYLHSKFDNAINFVDNSNNLITFVRKKIGSGPIYIVAENISKIISKKIEITKSEIIFNSNEIIKINNIPKYNSLFLNKIKTSTANTDKEIIKKNIFVLEHYIKKYSHIKGLAYLINPLRDIYFTTRFEKELIKKMKEGVNEIFSGEIINGIQKIKGLGFGLTPSGDDFIAGLIAALHFMKNIYGIKVDKTIDIIYNNSISNNIFSSTFTTLIKNGYFQEKIKNTLLSLRTGNNLRSNILNLLSFGASSGADFATGLFMMLNILCVKYV